MKAFDRHFNMLLVDVDEEYILNKVAAIMNNLLFFCHKVFLCFIAKNK